MHGSCLRRRACPPTKRTSYTVAYACHASTNSAAKTLTGGCHLTASMIQPLTMWARHWRSREHTNASLHLQGGAGDGRPAPAAQQQLQQRRRRGAADAPPQRPGHRPRSQPQWHGRQSQVSLQAASAVTSCNVWVRNLHTALVLGRSRQAVPFFVCSNQGVYVAAAGVRRCQRSGRRASSRRSIRSSCAVVAAKP